MNCLVVENKESYTTTNENDQIQTWSPTLKDGLSCERPAHAVFASWIWRTAALAVKSAFTGAVMAGTRSLPLWLLMYFAVAMLHAEEAGSTSVVPESRHADTRPPVSEPAGTVAGSPLQVTGPPNPADPDGGRIRQRRRVLFPRLPPSFAGRVPPGGLHVPKTTPRPDNSHLTRPGTSEPGLKNVTIAKTPAVPIHTRTSLLGADAASDALSSGATIKPSPVGITAVPHITGIASESLNDTAVPVHETMDANKTRQRAEDNGQYGEFPGCGELESCEGRCGEWNSTFNCQCDASCREFGDCCRDYHTECETTSNGTGGDLQPLKVIMADSCRWRCHDDSPAFARTCSCVAGCVRAGTCCADHHLLCMQSDAREREEEDLDDRQPLQCIGTPGLHDHYWMVATCPAAVRDAAVRNMCEVSSASDPDEDALRHVPVFDTTTNTSYRNLFCAHCNNATKKLSWQGLVRCFLGGSLRRMLTRPVSNPYCDWELVPPVTERPCVPQVIYDSQDSSCDRDRCSSYTANVYLNGPTGVKKYRNIDCARCASSGLKPNVTCSRDAALQGDRLHSRVPTLRIMFDFSELNKTKARYNGRTGTQSCPFGKQSKRPGQKPIGGIINLRYMAKCPISNSHHASARFLPTDQTAGQVIHSSGGLWKVVVVCTILFCLVSKLTASMNVGAACQFTRCKSTGSSGAMACGPLVLLWAVSGVVTLTAIVLYDPQPRCFWSSVPFDGIVSCSTAPYATVTSYGGVLFLSTAADVLFFTSAACRSRLKARFWKLSKKELTEAILISVLLTVVFTTNLILSAFPFQTMSYVSILASSLLGGLVAAASLCNIETKQSHKEKLEGCSQEENTGMGSAISLVSFRQIEQ
ncbi:hypothetical protein Bbelb_356610 [Branchiostoma belcheri]|nr:hypothetical protein Bbelb_356610 [Branchiostoma belcheri]